MPDYNAGTSWDQGLSALGPMLFPDPSKIAQAGYLGAQQRSERLKGDEMQQQMSARNSLPGIIAGLVGDDQYTNPGPRVPGVGQQVPPGPWPGQQNVGTGVAVAGQGPPPTAVLGQGQGQPGGAAAAITSAMPGGGAPVWSGPLANIPGSKVTPPLQPNAVPAAAQAITQGPLHALATTGQPPVQSSPAPNANAPPASNLTTTNGDAPPNDNQSGGFHPASVTAPGGGVKYGGPAAADGSPAKALDLGPLMVAATRAGYNGDQIAALTAAVIDKALQHGVLDHNTANQMLASIGRGEGLQSDTTMAQQALVTGAQTQETAREFDLGKTTILDDSDTVRAIPNSMWAKDPLKYPYIDPAFSGQFAAANIGTIAVHPNLPGSNRPDMTRSMLVPKRQAVKEGLTPTKSDWSPIGSDTQGAEDASLGRDSIITGIIEKEYSAEKPKPGGDYSRQEPGELGEDAANAVRDRANIYMRTDPKFSGDQKNYGAAVGQAVRDLQKEHYLETRQEAQDRRKRNIGDKYKGMLPFSGEDQDLMQGQDASGNPRPAFKIKLLKPYKVGTAPDGKKPVPDGAGAGVQTPPQLGNIFGNKGVPGQPTPGQGAAGMPAPPGSKPGDVVKDAQGNPMKVQNGIAVPLNPAEAARYQAWVAAHQQQGAVAGAP